MSEALANAGTSELASAVEALAAPSPAWLADARRAAWARYEAAPLPSRVEHLWRYTDPARLLPEGRALQTPEIHFGDLPGDFNDGIYENAAAYALCRDGAMLSSTIDPLLAGNGLVVG